MAAADSRCDRPWIGGRVGPQQVHHRLVGARGIGVQQHGRPAVSAGPPRRRQVCLDGGAQQRVHEAQRQLPGQQAGAVQLVGGRLRLAIVEPGERGRVPQLAAPQHGDRARQLARVAAQAGQAPHDAIAQPLRRQRFQPRGRLARGGQGVLARGAQQLAHEQRVARRRLVAASRELDVGLAQLADRQRAHRPCAQPRRRQHMVAGDRTQLGERLVRRGWLAAALCHHQQQRQILDAPGQMRQPAQRRAVHPLQIVDHQHQRLALRQCAGQRHQRVTNQERAIGVACHTPAAQRDAENIRRGRRRTGEEPLPVGRGERMDLAFEQLTHHPVTEVPLERGTRRSQHPHARLIRQTTRLVQQSGLPDPRLADDHDHPAGATANDDTPLVQRRPLNLSLEQPIHDHADPKAQGTACLQDDPKAIYRRASRQYETSEFVWSQPGRDLRA